MSDSVAGVTGKISNSQSSEAKEFDEKSTCVTSFSENSAIISSGISSTPCSKKRSYCRRGREINHHYDPWVAVKRSGRETLSLRHLFLALKVIENHCSRFQPTASTLPPDNSLH
jgi:hypothetical protein